MYDNSSDSELDREAGERLGPPRAPLRIMAILAELANAPEGVSLARLSEVLEMPKTTVFSMLRALEFGNFVVSNNGYHQLDREAFSLASAIMHHDSLAMRLKRDLQWLQGRGEETATIAVPVADWSKLILADVIEASSSLRFMAKVGDERPIYSTSLGLVLLAFASPEQQKAYIAETKLVRLTPSTISSASALKKALTAIRRDGYVINKGWIAGLMAIGAPIFDSKGMVVASVALAGPASRMEDREAEMIALVCEGARRMSATLGYRGG